MSAFIRGWADTMIRKGGSAAYWRKVAAGVPKRFQHVQFKHLDMSRDPTALGVCAQYAIDGETEHRNGLYLFGPPGNGKTSAAAAILHEIALAAPHPAAVWVNVPDAIDNVRRSFGASGGDSEGLVGVVRGVPFVVLDDLGAEAATEWVREVVYALINHLYNNNVRVIITTNVGLDAYGDRVVSRVLGMCHEVRFTGRDSRLHQPTEVKHG